MKHIALTQKHFIGKLSDNNWQSIFEKHFKVSKEGEFMNENFFERGVEVLEENLVTW